MEDIVTLIRKTDSKDKTVVFVESRELGNAIVQKCGFGNRVTADSKYPQDFSYEIYTEIVKNEKFDGRLLVCTTVLENGINLKDTKIKNVVIFANDKTRFLQMLGRVRRELEQQINLYVQNEEMSDISYRIEAKAFYNTLIREKKFKPNSMEIINTILHPVFTLAAAVYGVSRYWMQGWRNHWSKVEGL